MTRQLGAGAARMNDCNGGGGGDDGDDSATLGAHTVALDLVSECLHGARAGTHANIKNRICALCCGMLTLRVWRTRTLWPDTVRTGDRRARAQGVVLLAIVPPRLRHAGPVVKRMTNGILMCATSGRDAGAIASLRSTPACGGGRTVCLY